MVADKELGTSSWRNRADGCGISVEEPTKGTQNFHSGYILRPLETVKWCSTTGNAWIYEWDEGTGDHLVSKWHQCESPQCQDGRPCSKRARCQKQSQGMTLVLVFMSSRQGRHGIFRNRQLLNIFGICTGPSSLRPGRARRDQRTFAGGPHWMWYWEWSLRKETCAPRGTAPRHVLPSRVWGWP